LFVQEMVTALELTESPETSWVTVLVIETPLSGTPVALKVNEAGLVTPLHPGARLIVKVRLTTGEPAVEEVRVWLPACGVTVTPAPGGAVIVTGITAAATKAVFAVTITV
jgi:hypothetical protein